MLEKREMPCTQVEEGIVISLLPFHCTSLTFGKYVENQNYGPKIVPLSECDFFF